MPFFARNHDAHDLHHQIAVLRKEMAALSRPVSKRGAASYRDASDGAADLYEEFTDRVGNALPVIRQRAHDLEATIRDNPMRTVAVAGLIGLAVAATFMLAAKRR